MAPGQIAVYNLGLAFGYSGDTIRVETRVYAQNPHRRCFSPLEWHSPLSRRTRSARKRRNPRRTKSRSRKRFRSRRIRPLRLRPETGRLSFLPSPRVLPKGLLSQQVRVGLKAISQNDRGATIVKLRAFVAGTGDMRRVGQIVSEVFRASGVKHDPGGRPAPTGAQVVARKHRNGEEDREPKRSGVFIGPSQQTCGRRRNSGHLWRRPQASSRPPCCAQPASWEFARRSPSRRNLALERRISRKP